MLKLFYTYFTIEFHLGSQKDYSTYTRANDYEEVKKLLEDYCSRKFNPLNKIKYVRVYEIKKGRKFRNVLIDRKTWDLMISTAFPNTADYLSMDELERKSEHRWNIPSEPKINNGFKGGKENWAYKNMKGKSLPMEKRRNVRYNGKWKEISEEEVIAEKEELLEALESCGGNKSKAAEKLGLNRNTFYKRLRRHPDTDWASLIKEIKKTQKEHNDNSNSRQPPGV